jgi:hypothetical protein
MRDKSLYAGLLAVVFLLVAPSCLAVADNSQTGTSYHPYPLNEKLGGSLGTWNAQNIKEVGIKLECSVTKKPGRAEYVYRYNLINDGTEPVMVHWEVLDKVMGAGSVGDDWPIFIKIDPEKNFEFTLQSTEQPVELGGRLSLYESMKKIYGIEKQMKDNKFNVPGINACWARGLGSFFGGPVPPSFIMSKK